MDNLLSYCGLVDARISASEKDLPVCHVEFPFKFFNRWKSLRSTNPVVVCSSTANQRAVQNNYITKPDFGVPWFLFLKLCNL